LRAAAKRSARLISAAGAGECPPLVNVQTMPRLVQATWSTLGARVPVSDIIFSRGKRAIRLSAKARALPRRQDDVEILEVLNRLLFVAGRIMAWKKHHFRAILRFDQSATSRAAFCQSSVTATRIPAISIPMSAGPALNAKGR
jgi:hypothetical protein